MKKILVPCDFSKTALNAYQFALEAASKSRGAVHVVSVIELPVIHDTMAVPAIGYEQSLFKEYEESFKKRFSKLETKFKVPPGVKVKYSVLFGRVARMISDFAAENKMEVIIMGSHGATGAKEVLIGSNAEKLVRNSPVPVLVIKKSTPAGIKNIIFPNTLKTEQQEELVMKVKALQAFFDAHLHVLWINTPSNFTPDNQTFERLNKFAKRFMLKNYTLHVFNSTFEEEGIIEFTKMIKGDMIAMGTHGRKGFSHAILGSTAEDVVNHVQCPIWTYVQR